MKIGYTDIFPNTVDSHCFDTRYGRKYQYIQIIVISSINFDHVVMVWVWKWYRNKQHFVISGVHNNQVTVSKQVWSFDAHLEVPDIIAYCGADVDL